MRVVVKVDAANHLALPKAGGKFFAWPVSASRVAIPAHAEKSRYLLCFRESVPEIAAKLKEPSAEKKESENVVTEGEHAGVPELPYCCVVEPSSGRAGSRGRSPHRGKR